MVREDKNQKGTITRRMRAIARGTFYSVQNGAKWYEMEY